MKTNLIKYLALSCILVTLFSACRKDDYSGTEAHGKGESFIRIVQAPLKNYFFDSFTNVKTVTLFTIRRDAATEGDLQKAQVITIKDLGQSYLDSQFEIGEYVNMPINDLYVLSNDNIKKTSDGFSVNFPAGSDVQEFTVKINGSKIVAPKYAVALAITDANGLKHSVGQDTIVATVGIKNKYDGDYSATGSISFPAPTAGRTWDARDKTLTTVNATTSETEAGDLGGNGFFMYLKVNADNTVTVTPSPDSANQTIQNNGPCSYDPATGKFTLNYKYVGGTGDRAISETITLK